MQHGLRVSVCEIDPAVYDFSRRYFALPEPEQVYLEDARKLLKRGRKFLRYDVIVHDVVRPALSLSSEMERLLHSSLAARYRRSSSPCSAGRTYSSH